MQKVPSIARFLLHNADSTTHHATRRTIQHQTLLPAGHSDDDTMGTAELIDYNRVYDKDFADHIRSALAHQRSLERSILSTPKAGNGDGTTTSRSQSDDVHGLGDFLTELLTSTPFNEVIPASGNPAAQKALAVPELLETVLLALPVEDLSRVQRVSRHFYDAVEGSAKLQEQLSQRTRLSAFFRTPFRSMRKNNFACSLELAHDEVTGLVLNDGTLTAWFGNVALVPGSRIRSKFIVQPPVKEMTSYINCCEMNLDAQADRYGHLDDIAMVRNESGLTIGDLYDAARRLAQAHEHCPFADWSLHRADGTVRVKPFFKQPVKLELDDPIFVRRKRYEREGQQQEEEDDEYARKMIAFSAAKHTGTCAKCDDFHKTC